MLADCPVDIHSLILNLCLFLEQNETFIAEQEYIKIIKNHAFSDTFLKNIP